MSRADLAVIAAACAGCTEGWGLLDTQARALAEGAAGEAGPALHAAVGMSALAATLCRFSEADWQAMPEGEPRLPDPLAEWFGAGTVPGIKRSDEQGLVTVFYTGAHSLGRATALRITVAVPLTLLDVEIADGGAAGPTLVAMRATTGGCRGSERSVSGTVVSTIPGSSAWRVTVPAGVSPGHLVFHGGEAIPVSGDVSWSETGEGARIAVTTDDASAIEGLLWPATAVASDFSVPVWVDLSDEDDSGPGGAARGDPPYQTATPT